MICVGQQSPETVYNLAKKAFKAGKHSKTIALAQQAKSALGQTNPKIESLLAQAYFQNGNIVEAKLAYEKLLALTPASKQNIDSFKPFIALGEQIDEALGKADRVHRQNIGKRRMEEADQIIVGYQAQEESQRERLRQESKGPEYYFSKVQKTGDIQSYEDFKKSFPDSDLARKAEKELNDLKEKRKIDILQKSRIQPGEILVDPRDGQRYKTVIISDYVFMAENLNYDMDGSIEAGVDTDNPKPYGHLYTFYAAQKACPPGWKIPSSNKWAILMGDVSYEFAMHEGISIKGQLGKIFKSRYGWGANPNNGYDAYGFNALPVGYGMMVRNESGGYKFNRYLGVGHRASFWTSRTTTFDDQIGLALEFSYDTDYDLKQRKTTRHLAACRCYKVKEEEPSNVAGSNKKQKVSPESSSQSKKSENGITVVEKQPSVIGGMAGLYQRIRYPQQAIQNNIEGTVMVQFVVTKDGAVENAKVLKGIGAGCDQEALRVIKSTKFIPGTSRGKPVNVRLTIPITFRLN
jgi:TonB family protein